MFQGAEPLEKKKERNSSECPGTRRGRIRAKAKKAENRKRTKKPPLRGERFTRGNRKQGGGKRSEFIKKP